MFLDRSRCHITEQPELMSRRLAVHAHESSCFSRNLVSVGPTTRHVSRLAIKTLLERGDSASAIVKATGRSLSTVKRWIRKWKEAKREGIPDHIAVMDKPHSGKPPTITPSI